MGCHLLYGKIILCSGNLEIKQCTTSECTVYTVHTLKIAQREQEALRVLSAHYTWNSTLFIVTPHNEESVNSK